MGSVVVDFFRLMQSLLFCFVVEMRFLVIFPFIPCALCRTVWCAGAMLTGSMCLSGVGSIRQDLMMTVGSDLSTEDVRTAIKQFDPKGNGKVTFE